jgi:hypothetical protein
MKRTSIALLVATCFIAPISSASPLDNWRTGKTGVPYFQTDMTMSERLKGARDAIDSELAALSEVNLKLETDIKEKILSSIASIDSSITKLDSQIRQLCELGRKSGYTGVQFDGIALGTVDAFDAKLRLMISSLKSNIATLQYFRNKETEYTALREKIIREANELDVMKQSIARFLDPKRTNELGSSHSAIQEAITGIDAGTALRASYSGETVEQIFAKAAESNKTITVTPQDLEKAKREYSQASIKANIPTETKWWQIWQ